MKKQNYLALITVVGLVLLGWVVFEPVAGLPTGIIVSGAAATAEVPMGLSPDVQNSASTVGPRFVVQYANTIKYYSVQPLPAALQTLVGQVTPKFIILAARTDKHYSLTYPIALVGDSIAPAISSVVSSAGGAGRATIQWQTDEYANSIVRYGSQSGAYASVITNTFYFTTHVVSLVGLLPGTKYYYQVASIDRSNNAAQSAEYFFVATIPLYLPFIRR